MSAMSYMVVGLQASKAVAIVCHIKSQTSNSPHHIKLHMETANAGLIFNRQLETSKVIVFAEDLPKLDFLQILEGTSNIKLIDPQKWSQYSTRKKQACTTEKVMSRNGSLENNDNSTSTPKLMPGQNKEYTTPDEAFNALRSNERRINSMAIKQIVENIRKLADLQTIDLSLYFV
ncbi:unnamed protein product [Mytilus coruscus]|uniref:Uncharacterized protein n=1 Tax=Mytilus coruscus TaxID=42192 RepID=A0A6J8E8L2_MYTCO|nr:unnamed protein product [Mytilus coruscus]